MSQSVAANCNRLRRPRTGGFSTQFLSSSASASSTSRGPRYSSSHSGETSLVSRRARDTHKASASAANDDTDTQNAKNGPIATSSRISKEVDDNARQRQNEIVRRSKSSSDDGSFAPSFSSSVARRQRKEAPDRNLSGSTSRENSSRHASCNSKVKYNRRELVSKNQNGDGIRTHNHYRKDQLQKSRRSASDYSVARAIASGSAAFTHWTGDVKKTRQQQGRATSCPGSSVGDFDIQRELGRGAHGIVHLARSKVDDGLYVLKEINVRNMKKHQRKRAVSEVLLLRRLQHPNIIQYYTSFVDSGSLYIVMEYANGGDMYKEIKSRASKVEHFAEDQVWDYFRQIASGLCYLHRQNIIHRDVKSMNIFLMKEGNVAKLGDLGVSRIMENNAEGRAMAAEMSRVGTPMYFAPELVKREAYDFRVDVWSLGCLMYTIMQLEPPFRADNIYALAVDIVNKPPIPLPRRYSYKLREIVSAMLEKNPNKRPDMRKVVFMFPVLLREQILTLLNDIDPIPEGDNDDTLVGSGKRHDLPSRDSQAMRASSFEGSNVRSVFVRQHAPPREDKKKIQNSTQGRSHHGQEAGRPNFKLGAGEAKDRSDFEAEKQAVQVDTKEGKVVAGAVGANISTISNISMSLHPNPTVGISVERANNNRSAKAAATAWGTEKLCNANALPTSETLSAFLSSTSSTSEEDALAPDLVVHSEERSKRSKRDTISVMSGKSSLSQAGGTIIPARSSKLGNTTAQNERQQYHRRSEPLKYEGALRGDIARPGRRPWQTHNMVSVNMCNTLSKSLSVRGNRVRRSRPSSAYPDRRSLGHDGRVSLNYDSSGAKSRGKFSQRPSSAPRQRKAYEGKREQVVDKIVADKQKTHSKPGHHSKIGRSASSAHHHVPQRRYASRPQSATGDVRSAGRSNAANFQDREIPVTARNGNIMSTDTKIATNAGSHRNGSNNRASMNGMIVVKQWRPRLRYNQDTRGNMSGGRSRAIGTRRGNRRPQTALGTRRSRKPGV